MVDQEKSTAQVADEAKVKTNLLDPYDYLATFPNAPSRANVEAFKAQAPNGVIRILALASRVYLVRGIGGLELASIQSGIPENLGAGLNPEARAAKIEAEISLHVAARCTVWASTSPNGTLSVEGLRMGSAGLPSTLFGLVTWLSDFVDPEAFQIMSAEL